ncbi:MAG: hypothetical protein ACE5HA_01655, partial [Anaerolineae bacterium]
MFHSQAVKSLGILLCIVLISSVASAGPVAPPAPDEPITYDTMMVTSPLVSRIADRTLNMRFENWDWDSG